MSNKQGRLFKHKVLYCLNNNEKPYFLAINREKDPLLSYLSSILRIDLSFTSYNNL